MLLPTLWPIAHRLGSTGRDVVGAFLAGYQVDYLANTVFGGEHYDRGWHATSTIGTLGAATASALGIASSSACGIKVNFGTDAKPLHAGLSARGGLQAEQLAGHGITGSHEWLTGRFGMLSTFGGDTDVEDVASLWNWLDRSAHGISSAAGLTQKPYTRCGSCHSTLDAVIELSAGIRAEGREVR